MIRDDTATRHLHRPAIFQVLILVLLLNSLLANLAAQAAATERIRQVAPPPGFAGFEAPQTLFADVFFDGRPVGSTKVVASPGRVELTDVEAVVALLPPVSETGRPAVIDALSGTLDANTGLSCLPRRRAGCGELAPAVAGVIFDDAYLQLTVFVNPRLFALDPDSAEPRHLAPSSSEAAGFFNPFAAYYSGAFGGGTDARQNLNAYSDSYLSRGATSLRLGTSYAESFGTRSGASAGHGFALDDASILHVRPGWLYEGGLFRTETIDLVGGRRLVGIGARTTTATRLDLDRARGIPLTVSLPSRAVVELVANGRVVSQRSYPAGNQILDTQGLPEGAYDVTIRIRDEYGGTTEETRYFARSRELPLFDAPTYVLQAGVLATDERQALPAFTGDPAIRAGTAFRLTDEFGLGGDIFATTDEAVLALDGTWLSRAGMFSGTILGSSGGDYGIAVSAFGSLGRLSYGLDGQALFRSEEPDRTGTNRERGILGDGFRQIGLSLSLPLSTEVELAFQGRWRDERLDTPSYAFGPRLTWRILSGAWTDVDLNVDVTRTQSETRGLVQLNFRQTAGRERRWAFTERLAADGRMPRQRGSSGGDTLEPTASTDVQWRDGSLLADDLRVKAGLSSANMAGYIGFEHANEWVRTTAEAQRTGLDTGAGVTGFVGGISSAFALGEESGLTFGGADRANAAIVVLLRGGDETTRYDVLVDGQRTLTVTGSARTILPLAPFRQYRIGLRPAGGSPVAGDLRERIVTLYPGNVVTLEWRTTRIVALFGRVVGSSGAPIGRARIEGAEGPATTDDAGLFLIDVRGNDPLTVRKGESTCRLDLSDVAFDGPSAPDFINVGDRSCI